MAAKRAKAKPKAKPQAPGVELIRWLDHCSYSDAGWKPQEFARTLAPAPMVSVGYVAHETDDYVTLVASWGERNGDISGEICIIKRAILGRQRLPVNITTRDASHT